MERLDITQEMIDEAGMTGLMSPVKITCSDHEGGGSAVVQQWDGSKWTAITDFIEPHRTQLRPAYEASAAQYAKEQGIRSAERRVGKAGVSTCRSRWSPDHSKKKEYPKHNICLG